MTKHSPGVSILIVVVSFTLCMYVCMLYSVVVQASSTCTTLSLYVIYVYIYTYIHIYIYIYIVGIQYAKYHQRTSNPYLHLLSHQSSHHLIQPTAAPAPGIVLHIQQCTILHLTPRDVGVFCCRVLRVDCGRTLVLANVVVDGHVHSNHARCVQTHMVF